MAREITAGVLLKLKDQFSSQIKGAGVSVQGFADKANKAFSGVAGTLGTLGVSIGAGMLVKASIDYEDAMIRVGTNAGMTAAETNRLRRELLETAAAEKISVKELESFASTLANNAVGFDVISESAGFAAQAVQGLGITGAEAADLLSVLVNRGADVDTFKEKLNNLAEIDNRLQGMGLAEFTRYIPQLMELSGAGVDGIEGLYLSILTLNNGAANKKAIAQYASAMQDFAGSRDKIRRFLGFDTKTESGELKSFADIMTVLAAKANEVGDYEIFGKALGLNDATIMAMKQFNNHYQNTIDKVGELGDTSNAVSRRAAQNAASLKSALTGLHDAVLAQADGALTKPIEKLAKLLNENPDGLEKAVKGVGIALGALATMKALTTVMSFIGSIKGIKGGGGLDVSGAGGAGIPVHVTNWGGAAGSSMMPITGNTVPQAGRGTGSAPGATPGSLPGTPLQNARSAVGNITAKQYAGGAAGAGLAAAVVKIPQMAGELKAVKQDETLTNKERGKAKGGAIGDATGSIIGAAAGGAAGIAAGAAVGAAVGSVVPVLGTAVGALVGAGIGALGMWLGGKAGRAAGSAIGGAVAGDDETAAQSPEALYDASGAGIPSGARGRPGVKRNARGHGRPPRQVNDLIITPQGQFSTHPDDYILAMKNPAAMVNPAMPDVIRNEVRSVERVPQAVPPVVINGEIELRSELVIDDKGYRLRQQAGKNTTPYKFSVGSAGNARLIQ